MAAVRTIELRKYPGRPNRTARATLLGSDEHGTWLHVDRVVYLVPHEGWWKARHFPDGGWKVDIATPPQWHGDRVVLDDLALDVRRLHGRVWIEDEDEFAAAVADGTYPPDIAEGARRACDELAARMYDEPFRSAGDRWMGRIPGPFDTALLLDMGGVLTGRSRGVAAVGWERRLGLAEGAIARELTRAVGPGWEGGREPEEMDRIAAAALGVDSETLQQIRVDLTADTELDPRFVALIRSLPETSAAAIVSNNGAAVRRVWEAAYGISALVPQAIVSGEERIAKPDPLLYEIAAWRIGLPPERCVFVDDDPVNVEAACRLGMVGIRHTADAPAYDDVEAALAALA